MSEQEIIENNKLIAEFMGYKSTFLNKRWFVSDYIVMRYHSSWGWLMPVVEKIEKEFTVKIIRYADELSNVCEIETTEDDPLQIAYCCGYDCDGKTKIQVVFDAVVEFIKWYNQNK